MIHPDVSTMLKVHGAHFSGNEATYGGGGGIFCGTGVSVKLADMNISSNTGIDGGGVALFEVRGASMKRCTFNENTASDGGGVYVNVFGGAEIHVDDCIFEGNLAGASCPASVTTFLLFVTRSLYSL